MKRELAFALEARSQFSSFTGRTRSDKSPPVQVTDRRSKQIKVAKPDVDLVISDQSKSEESGASDVINGGEEEEAAAVEVVKVGDEGGRSVEKVYVKRKKGVNRVGKRFTRSALVENENLEMKMCKKMPTNMKELLETGWLEGFRVEYDFDAEGKNLQGVIKGVGILCSCNLCEGTKVISPSQFEMHACKSYRHAIKHIRLENGKSLLDVIEICKASASESVQVGFQTVISSLPVKGPSMCTKCNGLIEASSTENLLICDSCVNKKKVEAEHSEVRVATRGQVRIHRVSSSDLKASDKKNLELKMSKKIGLGRMPTNMRELLETGWLEGFRVEYDSDTEGKNLQGVIKGVGILCSCNLCEGTKVIAPSQFELHACKSYRHAIKHIRLENGKSLLDVIEICKASASESVEVALQTVISSLPVKGASTCTKCNCLIEKSSTENLLICDACMNKKQVEAQQSETSVATHGQVRASSSDPKASDSNTSSISFEKKNKRGRKRKSDSVSSKSSKSALKTVRRAGKFKFSGNKITSKILKRSSRSASAPRSIMSVTKCNSSQQKSGAKLTIKNLRLHWPVFQEGGLPDGTELTYVARGKICLKGYKLGNGICCSCCESEISASQFEAHAGYASHRKPYDNIFTSNGLSLHDYAVSLKKTESGRRPVKENNDLCIVCREGGDLLLCDGCPRSFHLECAGEPSIPRGKWFCRYCQQSWKAHGENANALAAGRVAGVDPIEQIMTRCIRIVKHSENSDLCACVLCRRHDFSKSVFNDRTVIVCDQCEKEYHIGCLREHNMADLKELPRGEWFCNNDCERINSALKTLLAREPETLSDDVLTFLKEKQKNDSNNLETAFNHEMKFVVLRGKNATRESKTLLAQTVKIFHEGFDPIIDAISGRDFIPSMVYGRKIWSQDFAGMFCAILTIDSIVVTAGTLRVFGEDLAELPIVATSKSNQGKGYFQLLFTCIERLLSSLKVKKLVLPAAEEAKSIWTNKFGFETIEPDQLNELRKSCSAMMTFQGTSMLQKEIRQAQVGVADAGDHGRSNPSVE